MGILHISAFIKLQVNIYRLACVGFILGAINRAALYIIPDELHRICPLGLYATYLGSGYSSSVMAQVIPKVVKPASADMTQHEGIIID